MQATTSLLFQMPWTGHLVSLLKLAGEGLVRYFELVGGCDGQIQMDGERVYYLFGDPIWEDARLYQALRRHVQREGRLYFSFDPHEDHEMFMIQLQDAKELQMFWLGQDFLNSARIVRLSPGEWDSFSRERMEDADSSLPKCCADVSELRSVILDLHRNEGLLTPKLEEALHRAWGCVSDSHGPEDFGTGTLQKLILQAGLFWFPNEKVLDEVPSVA